jgi:RNA polymerase sigma-70 factor (ECF subfamily)
MAPEAADGGPALARFQDYLHLLTRLPLDPGWQGKIDRSGVVRQTLFEAHRAWEQLGTRDQAWQMAWLRRALAHNLTDAVRKLGACRRGAAPERSLDQALEESSARLESWLADGHSSPSARRADKVEVLASCSC